jgi:ankyrin repeat protein
MDPVVAAEVIGGQFLKSLKFLVTRQSPDNWKRIEENILRSPRGIIGVGRNGYSLLHAFFDNRHDAALQLLLSKGDDIDARDTENPINGRTLLYKAISDRGDEDLARRLLEAGASWRCFAYHTTPLHMATRKGWENITTMLLERGADINAPEGSGLLCGDTPLHAAVRTVTR